MSLKRTKVVRIFLVRPIEPNRGDILSRYGLMKRLAGINPSPDVVVLSDRNPSEMPFLCRVVKPGPLKDLIPRWSQIRLYRRGDEVWWACGHDFQDDSSLLKLPFLLIKFVFFRIMGLKIRIVAQGAGPIRTLMGRICLRFILSLAKDVSLRDEESLRLIENIAPRERRKLRLSADQALYAADAPIPSSASLDDGCSFTLGVNLRRWFHFDGHWLPYEYRIRLGLLKQIPGNDKMAELTDIMAQILKEKIKHYKIRVLLIPMYPPGVEPWEDDLILLGALRDKIGDTSSVSLLTEDLPPEDFLKTFQSIDAMIGMRLHSTIAATVFGKPAIHLSYSPKGDSYFKRIGIKRYCLSIESLFNNAGVSLLSATLNDVIENHRTLSLKLGKEIALLKGAFAHELMDAAALPVAAASDENE
jgi:polysaccharide pyruvyl transferase WcaK-like protein